MHVNAHRERISRPARQGSAGFSLVEVLVALVVVSIGLLGLAKMESLALSSTTVAGARSIAAIEAASMAAMMHANPDFWQTSLAYPTTTITSAAGGNPFAAAPTCVVAGAAACTPNAMANYDLRLWAAALAPVLPTYSATITCSTTLPITCVIQINWADNAVAMTSQQTAAALAALVGNGTFYTMYVQP